MFASTDWKNQITKTIQQLELQVQDLKRNESELKSQNARLAMTLKSFARKMVSRMPISIESLEKGLMYDLIFSDEIEAWRQATRDGILLDIRVAHEYAKNSIPGSLNIPFDQINLRIENLAKDQAVLLVCDNGVKSVTASEQLAAKGFNFLYVLKGGMSLFQGVTESSISTCEAPSPSHATA
jgi:rhodanese-related sulfurtransferase